MPPSGIRERIGDAVDAAVDFIDGDDQDGDLRGHRLGAVSQAALGISDEALQRASKLTQFCKLCYRGGRSYPRGEGLEYKPNTAEAFANDESRMASELAALGENYRGQLIRTDVQQAAVFENDKEIIVAIEGSDMLDPEHLGRHFPGSQISYMQHAILHTPRDEPVANNRVMPITELVKSRFEKRSEEEKEALVNTLLEGKVHGGWSDVMDKPVIFPESARTLGNGSFYSAIEKHLEALQAADRETGRSPRKITFTGHSSGGALSMIAAYRFMARHPNHGVQEIYTFGQPRVGNPQFREGLYQLIGGHPPPIYRFEIVGDVVPSMPPLREHHYVHTGQWVCLSPRGLLAGLTDEHNKVMTAHEASTSTEVPTNSQRYINEKAMMQPSLGEKYGRAFLSPEHAAATLSRVLRSSKTLLDGTLATILGLADIDAHRSGLTVRAHHLDVMHDALQRQIRHTHYEKTTAPETRLGFGNTGQELCELSVRLQAYHPIGEHSEAYTAAVQKLDALAQSWKEIENRSLHHQAFTIDGNTLPPTPVPYEILPIGRLIATDEVYLSHAEAKLRAPKSLLTEISEHVSDPALLHDMAELKGAMEYFLDSHEPLLPPKEKQTGKGK